MKNIHIGLEYGDALYAKKEVLSLQINLLELLKNFKNYRAARRRELILKSRFKGELDLLREGAAKVQESFPEEKEEEEEVKIIQKGIRKIPKKQEKRVKKTEAGEYKDIETQLQEIKGKLARLG